MALAVELLDDLPDTFEALAAGRIDADKARLIADRTRCLADPALRRRVEAAVLPDAHTRTRWALDQRLRREVIAADPAGAEERRHRAAARRYVGRPEPATPGGEDGMATVTLCGPAEDLTALWIAVDAAARHARSGDEPRTLDQLRFDLLTGLAWTALESGHLGCCHPACATPDASPTTTHAPAIHTPAAAARPTVPGTTRKPGTTLKPTTTRTPATTLKPAGAARHVAPAPARTSASGSGSAGTLAPPGPAATLPAAFLSAATGPPTGVARHAGPAEARTPTAGSGSAGTLAPPRPAATSRHSAAASTLDPPVGSSAPVDAARYADLAASDPPTGAVLPADLASAGDPTSRPVGDLTSPSPAGTPALANAAGASGTRTPADTSGSAGPAGLASIRTPTVASGPAGTAEVHSSPTSVGAGGPVVLGRRRGAAASVHVTVPIDALAGADDVPGELDGYGPITAAAARRVAAEATERRLLTDPADGRQLEYGRTIYAPPVGLAAHVVARDRTCRFPTCHRPATEAEIDHRVAYAQGGTTDPDNTWALHDGHHRAKTWHGFTVATDPHGTTWWLTPAGRRYPVDPEVVGPIRRPRPPGRRPSDDAHLEAVPF